MRVRQPLRARPHRPVPRWPNQSPDQSRPRGFSGQLSASPARSPNSSPRWAWRAPHKARIRPGSSPRVCRSSSADTRPVSCASPQSSGRPSR